MNEFSTGSGKRAFSSKSDLSKGAESAEDVFGECTKKGLTQHNTMTTLLFYLFLFPQQIRRLSHSLQMTNELNFRYSILFHVVSF